MIVHVAQIDIARETGMGRVAWHWREAFLERGYEFVHIGASELGRIHPAFFPYAAYLRYRKLRGEVAAVLVHEPSGLPFVLGRRPVIAFSHGLERRGWQIALTQAAQGELTIRPRSRLLFPIWRLRQAEMTLRRADGVLVLNTDDLSEVRQVYRRRPEEVFAFRNGVYLPPPSPPDPTSPPSLLFVGSWLPRKGVHTLIQAVGLLRDRGFTPQVVIAGAGDVLAFWPEELRPHIRVVPAFDAAEESSLYNPSAIFLLPSLFEGQPLVLLQAMAAGCCCIASNISGVRDLITAGETGLLHPPQNPSALADLIQTCLASASLRQTLGQAARLAVAGRTWPAVANEVVDFVEAIIAHDERVAPSRGDL